MSIDRPMPPAPGTVGLFHGIDIADYHADKEAVSKSGLDDFHHAPLIYWAKRFDPDRPAEEVKAGHLEGNMLHCALLEPNHFGGRYVVVPDDAPRKPSITQRNAKSPSPDTIIAIDWWDRFNMESGGKAIVTADQYTTAWKQADSLRKIKAIAELMNDGMPEASAYWTDPKTGLYCRCRPDWTKKLGDKGLMLLDAKTTGDARPSAFGRMAGMKRYHVQDAFYTDGVETATGLDVLGFIFAAVESEWPYYASAVELGDLSKKQGRLDYRQNLKGLAECKRDAEWVNTSASVEVTDIPNYLITE